MGIMMIAGTERRRQGCSLQDGKQWGYLQKQAEKWIYPIPVLEAFIATKTCISNNHSAAGYVGYWTWDKDITTEYAYSWNNYPSYCFMIGKVQQQWGFDSGTAEKNIVILPLPVINPLSGFACLTDSNGAGDIGIKSMSSTSIVVDVDTNKAASRNFYWLVIAL